MLKKTLAFAAAASLALCAHAAFALSGDLLQFKNTMDISRYKGTTFLNFMNKKPDGVKAQLDLIATNGFKVTGPAGVEKALAAVDGKVSFLVLKAIQGGKASLLKVADHLNKSGKTYTLYTIADAVKTAPGFRGNMFAVANFLSLASGAGVAVKIDDRNYYYNVGYGTGKVDKDEMTGRSYGAGPTHKANDASDAFYLTELEKFLHGAGDAADFYRAMMQVLTNCDSSSYSKVAPPGQTVLTDFFAVYTAEQDRHLQSNLRFHQWDIDLAEVTLVSAFSASGNGQTLVEVDGKLVPTRLQEWWRKSKINPNRSGIGESRTDRHKLTKAISDWQRQKHPELVRNIEAVTGRGPNGDVFRAVMNYLVNFRTPTSLGPKANQLTEAVVAFIKQVRADAQAMVGSINAAP